MQLEVAQVQEIRHTNIHRFQIKPTDKAERGEQHTTSDISMSSLLRRSSKKAWSRTSRRRPRCARPSCDCRACRPTRSSHRAAAHHERIQQVPGPWMCHCLLDGPPSRALPSVLSLAPSRQLTRDPVFAGQSSPAGRRPAPCTPGDSGSRPRPPHERRGAAPERHRCTPQSHRSSRAAGWRWPGGPTDGCRPRRGSGTRRCRPDRPGRRRGCAVRWGSRPRRACATRPQPAAATAAPSAARAPARAWARMCSVACRARAVRSRCR